MPIIDSTPAFDDQRLDYLIFLIGCHLSMAIDARDKHKPIMLCEMLENIEHEAMDARERFCEVHRSLFPK